MTVAVAGLAAHRGAHQHACRAPALRSHDAQVRDRRGARRRRRGPHRRADRRARRARPCARSATDEPFLIARDTRRSGPMLEAALVAGICAEGGSARTLGVLPDPRAGGRVRGRPGARRHDLGQPQPVPGQRHQVLRGGRPEAARRVPRPASRRSSGRSSTAGRHRARGRTSAVRSRSRARSATTWSGWSRPSRPTRSTGCGSSPTAATGLRSQRHRARSSSSARRSSCSTPSPTAPTSTTGAARPTRAASSRAVRETGAHAGLAFDGDADRVVAVDEHGGIVDGDHILAIAALDLQARGRLRGNAIATTVMANLGSAPRARGGRHRARRDAGRRPARARGDGGARPRRSAASSPVT